MFEVIFGFTGSLHVAGGCVKNNNYPPPPKKNLQYQNKKSPSLTERGTETQKGSCPGLHLFPDSKKSRPTLTLSAQASGLVIPETGQSFSSARENCKDHACLLTFEIGPGDITLTNSKDHLQSGHVGHTGLSNTCTRLPGFAIFITRMTIQLPEYSPARVGQVSTVLQEGHGAGEMKST